MSFWEKNEYRDISVNLVRSAVEQLCGLADALKYLHSSEIIHGNIMPRNILWFNQQDDSLLGTLKLANIGSAKQSDSCIYEPPESIMDKESQLHDIWSMGCITLEFITWILLGHDRIRYFHHERTVRDNLGRFFESSHGNGEPATNLNHAVVALMNEIEAEAKRVGSTAIMDILNFVRNKLLVVHRPPYIEAVSPKEDAVGRGLGTLDLNDNSTVFPQGPQRATAEEFFHALDTIMVKGYNEGYWLAGERQATPH